MGKEGGREARGEKRGSTKETGGGEKATVFARRKADVHTKKVGCKAHLLLPPPLFLVNPLLERYDKGMRANISIRSSSSTARAESWIGTSSSSFHAVESGGTHPPHCVSVLFSPFLPLHSRQSEEQCAPLHLFLPIPVCAWRGGGEMKGGAEAVSHNATNKPFPIRPTLRVRELRLQVDRCGREIRKGLGRYRTACGSPLKGLFTLLCAAY